eukprot:4292295-Amphidinium_carterae.3
MIGEALQRKVPVQKLQDRHQHVHQTTTGANVIDCLLDGFRDEEFITKALELQEGVLYRKTMEEIQDLMNKARSGNDKEAENEYAHYLSEQARLEMTIQQESCRITSQQTEESRIPKSSRQHYRSEMTIEEDNEKKEEYRKEFLREREEEEKQKKTRQRELDELEASTASAAASGQRTELQQNLQFNPANKISMEPAVRQVLPL